MCLEDLTINELFDILNAKTNFIYELRNMWNGALGINVVGLKNKDNIEITFHKYSTNDERNGKKFISFNGSQKNGESGFGFPCDIIEKLLIYLNNIEHYFGYKIQRKQKQEFKQLALF